MEGVFWSDTPMLQTISHHEGVAPLCRSKFHEAILSALPPMAEYLALYAKYDAVVQMDVATYMAEYGATEKTIQEMSADVRKQLASIAAVEKEVPLGVTIGLFAVNTHAVRKFLVERHHAISKAILQLVASKVKARGEELTDAFKEINRSCMRSTPDVEAVQELEEYMAQLPGELDQLQQGLQEMLSDQLVLEGFEFETSDENFKTFWSTMAWPRRIDETIGLAAAKCVEKREEFAMEQEKEQEAFAKSLNKLEDVVSKFSKHTDLGKVKEISAEVKKLQAELKEAEAKKFLFNKREAILGTPLTDYSQLGKVMKAFEPFANLWITAANWKVWQTEWLEGPFTDLDPEDMEKELGNAQRTMFKLVKAFAGREGLEDIAKVVKEEVEEFMPVMPLVTALRNPGMRERHWVELSKNTGKDLTQAVNPEFTLTKLKTMGLDEHIETVTKTCDVAGKEFAIEQAMDKMEGEWKGVNLEIVPYRETGTYVLKGFDVIQQLLDDHIVMTQSMSFSPFKGKSCRSSSTAAPTLPPSLQPCAHHPSPPLHTGPFAQRIDDWERLLTLMADIFEEWIKCQRQWMYAQPKSASSHPSTHPRPPPSLPSLTTRPSLSLSCPPLQVPRAHLLFRRHHASAAY